MACPVGVVRSSASVERHKTDAEFGELLPSHKQIDELDASPLNSCH